MRLKISLNKENCVLPLNYQHLIQGMIYDAMSKDDLGLFYHDEGYKTNNKRFKMFVFSKLYGENTIDIINKSIIFRNAMTLFVSSEDEQFLQFFYNFFTQNKKIVLVNQIIDIQGVNVINLSYYKGEKELTIKTCSPSIVCRTDENRRVSYFKPSDEQFAIMVTANIEAKLESIKVKRKISFEIMEILSEKKRIVRFKNTSYEAYDFEIKVKTDYSTLLILYNTGIGSKGSSGFGMIEVK